MPRDNASAYCENRNSYLIEITTDEELEFARGLFSRYMFWIGATDREQDGTFIYQHSQQLVPGKYWAKGEPDNYYGEHCAYMWQYKGKLEFYDDNCRVYAYFVCEKP